MNEYTLYVTVFIGCSELSVALFVDDDDIFFLLTFLLTALPLSIFSISITFKLRFDECEILNCTTILVKPPQSCGKSELRDTLFPAF